MDRNVKAIAIIILVPLCLFCIFSTLRVFPSLDDSATISRLFKELATAGDFYTVPNKYSSPEHYSTIAHGGRCTQKQANAIAAQNPVKKSNCPNKDEWMSDFLKASYFNPHVTIVSVGCNIGDDLISMMREWSQNATYSVRSMAPYYKNLTIHACSPKKEPYMKVQSNHIEIVCWVWIN